MVLWKNGSETWVTLKDLKSSHPIEVSEFEKERGIGNETVFIWWFPCMLRKSNVMISSINNYISKTIHNNGIDIPTSVKDAYRIDEKNGNRLWK